LPTSSRKGAGICGYHWWPNGSKPDGRWRWPDAPSDTFARSGHNNNDLFVIPAWNIVTARLGLDQAEDEITSAEYNTFLRTLGEALTDATIEGPRTAWHPLTLTMRGPAAQETDNDPNPFLDYRLQVRFTGPTGKTFHVPGYFDGDGGGGNHGNLWQARSTPNEGGRWTYTVSFRHGKSVALSLEANAGEATAGDGQSDAFDVAPRDPEAPGFRRWGRLQYVGRNYLKFDFFLKPNSADKPRVRGLAEQRNKRVEG